MRSKACARVPVPSQRSPSSSSSRSVTSLLLGISESAIRNAERAKQPATTKMMIGITSDLSYVELQDLAQGKAGRQLKTCDDPERYPAWLRVQQRVGHVGLRRQDEPSDEDRHAADDARAEASLGGECAHLANDATPIADGGRQRLEHVRQVAAGLRLNANGTREHRHLVARHILGKLVERVEDTDADVGAADDAHELSACRIGDFFSHEDEGLAQTEADAQRAGQHPQHEVELLAESADAAVALEAQVHRTEPERGADDEGQKQ